MKPDPGLDLLAATSLMVALAIYSAIALAALGLVSAVAYLVSRRNR